MFTSLVMQAFGKVADLIDDCEGPSYAELEKIYEDRQQRSENYESPVSTFVDDFLTQFQQEAPPRVVPTEPLPSVMVPANFAALSGNGLRRIVPTVDFGRERQRE